MTQAVDLSGLPAPIVQAGMGAVARHELAAAVSEAGGLGTIGGARGRIADELAAARKLTGRPRLEQIPTHAALRLASVLPPRR